MKSTNWIKAPVETGEAAVAFTKKFSINKPIKRATARLSSMGNYAAYINGKRLGRGVLTPGYTSLRHRVQYFTYDIKDMLGDENVIEHTVAPGWAVGHIGYDNGTKVFFDHLSAIAEIEIEYADGSEDIISTDESWEVWSTPVLKSDIYMGETVDANVVPEKLGQALADNSVRAKLVPQQGEDIVENERIAPIAYFVTPNGERVVDFGQNLTGYVEFRVKGKKGERIETSCAEVLDKDGNMYTGNYRAATNKIIYVLDGERELYKPTYTFQGFRYIRLDDYPEGEVDLDAIRAIVVHSDIRRTGYFTCGNEKINQLYHNTIWGQKSNYLDVPTDCPQRNERLGWTGDAQMFCRTAALNFDVRRFFEKWMGDVRIEQTPEGAVYGIVPESYKDVNRHSRISAGWGDCATIIPWQLYQIYGDQKVLEENFELMCGWVEYLHGAGEDPDLWLGGYHYGDWLAMDAGEDELAGATSTDLIGSAYYVYSLSLVIKAGEILGCDVERYRELYKRAWSRFREVFMENGLPKKKVCLTEFAQKLGTDVIKEGITQTAIVLILHFDLCLPEEREGLVKKLCELIEDFDGRMSTGFIGSPYILHALSDNGAVDMAYKLLFCEKVPSWLYSVNHGATTMWEHWNSQKEDGSFWSDSMNSFNHYAYGSVWDWIYANAAGITTCEDGVGFKKIRLAPKPTKELGFVRCSLDTVAGRVESNWYYKGDRVYFEFTVPSGSTAEIVLPNGKTETVGAGVYHFVV